MIRALLLLSASLVGVYCQFGLHDDIGIYDGHLHGIDDIHASHYHGLRSGLGIAGGVGGVGVVGGAAIVGGGIRIGMGGGLRQCQRSAICTLQYIPPQCEYIPIFRDATGRYCRGCPENICLGQLHGGRQQHGGQRRSSRRLRRIQRRICRTTGRCYGQSVGPVGLGGIGVGGVAGIGGIGGIGVGGIGVGGLGGLGVGGLQPW